MQIIFCQTLKQENNPVVLMIFIESEIKFQSIIISLPTATPG